MPVYTMYCLSMSWDPIYSRIVLYKSMPAAVVLSMASLTNILRILLNIKIGYTNCKSMAHSIKYCKVIKHKLSH